MAIKQRAGWENRQLRALGHHLSPVLQIGKEGVTEAVIAQADRELLSHELIKIKVLETAPEDVLLAAERLADVCEAWVAQSLGRTALLYRPHPKDPAIQLVKPSSKR